MGEHKRQWVGTHARGLDEMDQQAVELDVAVLHAVEPCLKPGGLVSPPVGEQLDQPRVRDAVIPIVAERRPQLSVIKPSPQALERQRVKGEVCSDLHGQMGRLLIAEQARKGPGASRRTPFVPTQRQIC
jgi:hypothetical protein